MKTSIAKLALGLTLVSMSSVAMAGIATTKHNLGSSGNYNFTTATTEICVFCHTPHGADSSAAAPLWNRTLSTATYQTYASLGTSTFDANDNQPGGVSLACLSCHDGTQAMNTVINSPGSGTSGDVNRTKRGALIIADGDGVTSCVETGGLMSCGGFFEFNMMSQVAGEMIYLSTDLRNDHPISIQYAGAWGTSTGYDANDDFFAAQEATGPTNGSVFYLDTGGAGKQKTDLPLYNGVDGAMVECATCHDPHTNTTTFLRHPNGNNGSATCLTCHDK